MRSRIRPINATWREPIAAQRRLWIASGAAILASGLNPNGFRAIQVLVAYSSSPMQSALLEWQHTAFWELDWFGVLLFGTAAVLALSLLILAFHAVAAGRARPLWLLASPLLLLADSVRYAARRSA